MLLRRRTDPPHLRDRSGDGGQGNMISPDFFHLKIIEKVFFCFQRSPEYSQVAHEIYDVIPFDLARSLGREEDYWIFRPWNQVCAIYLLTKI